MFYAVNHEKKIVQRIKEGSSSEKKIMSIRVKDNRRCFRFQDAFWSAFENKVDASKFLASIQ